MAEKDNVRDYIGRKYNLLTVIEDAGATGYGRTLCKCLCDCGNIKITVLSDVKAGEVKSCGCIQPWATVSGEDHHSFKHGLKNHRLYSIMNKMKQRCYNENHTAYERYGGAGITVHEEWRTNFVAFYNWAMGNGYAEGLTIDRKDNKKGYSPDNCRWITRAEQNRNTKRSRKVTLFEETKVLEEWFRDPRIPVSKATFQRRKVAGMSDEKALLTPPSTSLADQLVDLDNKTHSVSEWCAILNVSIYTVKYRMNKKGMSVEDALVTPKKGSGKDGKVN
jgi:hypothetical protein